MDYKGALLKGLKAIPSSSSLKLNRKQPEPNIKPNWLNLPPELMVLIMQRIDWYDVLMNVKEVCKYWHVLSKDPSIWRVIEFRKNILIQKLRKKMGILTYEEQRSKYYNELDLSETKKITRRPSYTDCQQVEENFKRNVDNALQKMAMHATDLSCGQLHDLCLRDFGSDNLLHYIYQRCNLRRLRLEYCHIFSNEFVEPHQHDLYISDGGLNQMLRNLPLLEELQIPYSWISLESIEVAGRCCPYLESFSTNHRVYIYTAYRERDAEALAIAKNMPALRQLQLFGNMMTKKGLMAILTNCHRLEYLDLRQCYNLCQVLEKADFKARLHQQIKHVKFPQDSTEDYEFDATIYDSDGTCGL